MAEAQRLKRLYSRWLSDGKHAPTPEALREMGLALDQDAPRTILRAGNGLPQVNVHSCRLTRRIGADARLLTDWIVTITQRRRGYVDPAVQEAQDAGDSDQREDFIFRGGCTLVVDAATGQVRYCIAKDILANERLARRRESASQLGPADSDTPGSQRRDGRTEPFLLLRSG
jgi:hypothetical protein